MAVKDPLALYKDLRARANTCPVKDRRTPLNPAIAAGEPEQASPQRKGGWGAVRTRVHPGHICTGRCRLAMAAFRRL